MIPSHHKHKENESQFGLEGGKLIANGRFRLKRLIGRGTIGEVWSSYDNRVREIVVLKFLPPQLKECNNVVEKLRRDIRRCRKLAHPNIVRIYDFYEEPGELPFVVMEYVDGPSLHQFRLLRTTGALTWDSISPLLRQLCQALQYAHSESVIHGGIKLTNLLLDSQQRLKLSDFGICRSGFEISNNHVISRHGAMINSFASPQQATGETASFSDDIYGIGACVYELLTGSPPFYKGDVNYQILHTKPDPIAERLLELNIDNLIPPILEEFIQVCLDKDPTRRPCEWEIIFSYIDRIDKEYEEMRKRVAVSKVENQLVSEALDSATTTISQTAETQGRNLIVLLPLFISVIFCAGLLFFSYKIRKNSDAANGYVTKKTMQKLEVSVADSGVARVQNTGLAQKENKSEIFQSETKTNQDVHKKNQPPSVRTIQGRLIGEFTALPTSMITSDESSWIILSDVEGWMRMLNAKNGSLIWEKRLTRVPITAMAMMANKRQFVAGDSAGNLVLCSSSGGEKIAEFVGHNCEIVSIAISSKYLASLDGNGTIKIWDAISARFISEIKSSSSLISCMSLSSDGKMLAAGKQNGTVNFYLTPMDIMAKSLLAHNSAIAGMGFEPKDNSFYTLGKLDRTLKQWDLTKMEVNKQYRRKTPMRESFNFLQVHPQSGLALIVSESNFGYLINIETFSLINSMKFDIHIKPVIQATILNDKTIITAGADGYICRWEL